MRYDIERAILLYLASRSGKCATYKDLVKVVEVARASNSKDLYRAVRRTISRLRRKGYVKGTWITVSRKRVRLVCLRGAE